MTRKENHNQADSVPFYPSLEPSSGLLKYDLNCSRQLVSSPARPGHLKGTGQAGPVLYSTPAPGGGW